MPRPSAQQIGAVYARYSSKYQNSILDQVRVNLEYAAEHQIFVPFEYIFFDQAISGRKQKRQGLLEMEKEKCVTQKKVQALLVFATNQLHRRAIRALAFVEKVVTEHKVRMIFVMNHIDSQIDDKWKRFLMFLCLFDEFASEMYIEHIRASHVGKLLNRLVYGTVSFGYHGVEIPGTANRNGKPNRRIEIHPEHAAIVRMVFDWFVTSFQSINSIIRHLNSHPNVPPPPKGSSKQWTRQAVLTLLRNPRYRGEWSYGVRESVLLPEKDYIRQDPREQPLKTVHFEELRIVSDEFFYKAQARLAEAIQNSSRGRRRQKGDCEQVPKLLNRLFYCPAHDRTLHVGGPNGEYLICPSCRRETGEKRVLYSQLNREVALTKICTVLGEQIRNDSELVNQIVD